jgi:uncharacterized protein YndB with AHSA1/START domain
MEMRGVYKEIAPPERLVSTESCGGNWPETLNTLILTEGERQDDDHAHDRSVMGPLTAAPNDP